MVSSHVASASSSRRSVHWRRPRRRSIRLLVTTILHRRLLLVVIGTRWLRRNVLRAALRLMRRSHCGRVVRRSSYLLGVVIRIAGGRIGGDVAVPLVIIRGRLLCCHRLLVRRRRLKRRLVLHHGLLILRILRLGILCLLRSYVACRIVTIRRSHIASAWLRILSATRWLRILSGLLDWLRLLHSGNRRAIGIVIRRIVPLGLRSVIGRGRSRLSIIWILRRLLLLLLWIRYWLSDRLLWWLLRVSSLSR
mmetsp:Transcript_570/g.1045  ORF Transcript_570/g.1045 Transcript_570/m.1045 type:complete len:250 (+) Transcript_570:304-1053(+)